MRMGNSAARPNAPPIATKCHIRAATAKVPQLAPKRAERLDCATLIQLGGAFDPFDKPNEGLGMTIVQEITFALLPPLGAVAGSELIVRL